jgi:hexosaminidase
MTSAWLRFAAVAATAVLTGMCAAAGDPPGLVPWPASFRAMPGEFELDRATVIAAPSALNHEAVLLAEPLRRATGLPIPVVAPPLGAPDRGTILLRPARAGGARADEGYGLSVTPTGVVIEAATAAGCFYGTRTLLQLFPPQAAAGRRPPPGATVRWAAPCVEIDDAPRFRWRAFMLDDSRNFHGVAVVKRYLDEMAALKMNVFHWHFTDGNGWRLEIRRYPKLTSVGALSPGTGVGDIAAHAATNLSRYFYTQEEARDIVEYAARRHVRIVPEIEMPGHAGAAMRAYPEWSAAGVFDTTHPDTLQAIRNILDEVLAIFPGAAIHTGGDEVDYKAWERAPSVRAAMAAKGLSGSAPLQTEFTAFLASHLAAKGRRMIYWADSLEQIPSERSAIVQYWRGDSKLMGEAIARGHDLVNSDNGPTYLDYNYASLPLRKAYEFEPIPAGLDPALHGRVLGLGCQAWGEFTPSLYRRDQQVFPRLAAYGEVGWTPRERRDYAGFLARLKIHEARWDMAGIRYARDCGRPATEPWNETLQGACLGGWTPDQVRTSSSPYSADAANWREVDATKVVTEPGRYRVAFVPTGGVSTVHVRAVEMIEDGRPIAADWGGFGGGIYAPGRRGAGGHLFDLEVRAVTPGAKYALRINLFGRNGTDSAGQIFVRNAGDLQPVYVEATDPDLLPLRWKPDSVPAAPGPIEWNIADRMASAGDYTATFVYAAGAHGLDLARAELLENGTIVATDAHAGFAGAAHRGNVYRLALGTRRAGATYMLRLIASGNGGRDSHGIVEWKCVRAAAGPAP